MKLADALERLHRALIADTKREHERHEGPIGGPGDLLRLLTEHERFAWMHPLSALMADDEADLHHGVADLLEPGSAFSDRYLDVLQRDPEAVMAHAEVKAALRR